MNQFDEFTENLDNFFLEWKQARDSAPVNPISAVPQTENPPSLGAKFESSIKFFPYKVEELPPVAHKQPVICGGHNVPNLTLTVSGISFLVGPPDPNGVFSLPQTPQTSPVCGWEYDGDPNYIYTISFDPSFSPPWFLGVSAKVTGSGNPWEGQAVFTGQGSFGASVPSSLSAPPVLPQYFGGGVGTAS